MQASVMAIHIGHMNMKQITERNSELVPVAT